MSYGHFGSDGSYDHKSSNRCMVCQVDWPPIDETEQCPNCGGPTEEKPWMPIGKSTYQQRLRTLEKKAAEAEEHRLKEYAIKEQAFDEYYTARNQPAIDAECERQMAQLETEWLAAVDADWMLTHKFRGDTPQPESD